jgi:hypothetical protein
MMNCSTMERRAEAIVTSLRHGAGVDLIVATFEQVAADLGTAAEETVFKMVQLKLSRLEMPRRRRTRRNTRKGRRT